MDKGKGKRGFAPSQSAAAATSVKTWRELVRQYEEASAKRDEAFDRRFEATHAAFKEAVPPDAIKFKMFSADRGWRLDGVMQSDRDALRYIEKFAPGSQFAPKLPELRAAIFAHKQAEASAEAKHNVKALTDAHQQLAEEARQARARLMSAPAPDMDALAYKLRVAMTMFDDVFDPHNAGDTADILASPADFPEGSAMLAIYFDTLLLSGRADEVSKIIGAAKAAPPPSAELPRSVELDHEHRDDDGFSAREWINAFLAEGGGFATPDDVSLRFVSPAPESGAMRALLDELRADPSKKESVEWNLRRFGIFGTTNVTQAWNNAVQFNGGK